MVDKYLESNLKNIDSFQKLDMIEELEYIRCFTLDIYKFLDYLASDEDYEVRAKVAEILISSNSVEAENILIRLLIDKDELVRANACDSLCTSSSNKVIYHLKDRVLKDKSSLVKGYAILSLVDIVIRLNNNLNEYIEFFTQILHNQKVQWVRINIYKALYMLGDEKYLDILTMELENRYYRNRCAVVNILRELISNKNYGIIEKALIDRMEVENSIAVKSSIEDLLLIIKEKQF